VHQSRCGRKFRACGLIFIVRGVALLQSITMELIIILVLTVLNGFFSMSEVALISSRRFKLEALARKGSKGAMAALSLAASPTTFLSTVQIGITLIGLLTGIYSGENITEDVRTHLRTVSVLAPYAQSLSVVSVLLPVTFVTIILGELLPKRIGMSFPETIASAVARPMSILSGLVSPFIWLLTTANDFLLRIIGMKSTGTGIVTEEEIKSMVNESAESGEIQEIEQDIVERVFSMGDRRVGALMTHRSDLVWIDTADDLVVIRQKARASRHSAYPVARGVLDHVVGIVMIRDLFLEDLEGAFQIESFVRQPLFVPVSTPAYKLLEAFKRERNHYAIVLDEFGSVQGLVTLDDITDALVGDLSAESDQEYLFTTLSKDQWMFDGPFPFFELVHQLELDVNDDNLEFNTLAGFMIHRLERIPEVGDRIAWEGLELEVVEMNQRRVGKIKVTRLPVE